MTENTPPNQDAKHPPKVDLTFRVGVVGHRPNRLDKADLSKLSIKLEQILTQVREEIEAHYSENGELFSESPPTLRAISPLAEGVDRLFATQAINLNYELCAVLPFYQAEYETDFSEKNRLEADSLATFRNLLSQAKTVYELDGSEDQRSASFGVAGEVVLNQSDLLIVVWDGERQNHRGGTEETFGAAQARGVPVVWIDAHAPHHWKIVDRPLEKLDLNLQQERAAVTSSAADEELRMQVRRLVKLPNAHSTDPAVPQASSSDKHRARLLDYYKEELPFFSGAFWWKLFRDFFGDFRIQRPQFQFKPVEKAFDPAPVSSSVVDRSRHFLQRYYIWADSVADRYADRYRSTFILAYLFAWLAVVFVLLPIGLKLPAHSPGETLCTIGELICILLIMWMVIRGRRGRWHRRWLDARLLAELIRHQRLVTHLGGERATPSVPAHWSSYGDPANSWMAWYSRAVERTLGLPTAVVNQSHLEESVNDLLNLLGQSSEDPTLRSGQIGFHQTTTARSHRIEHRLHMVELSLLVLTLLFCGLHLAHSFLHDLHLPSSWLIFGCGIFPALGASLAGINNQGEFRRIDKRSRAMQSRLSVQAEKLERLKETLLSAKSNGRQISPEIALVASETARMMVNEVLDWRVMFQDRPLNTT